MVSVSLSSFAQTEDFDPVNPPNPTTPTVKYALKVNTKPEGLGSLNNAGGQYEAGETVSLYAYSREGFVFQGWYDASGKLLSVCAQNVLQGEQSFAFRGPAKSESAGCFLLDSDFAPLCPSAVMNGA